MRKKVMILGAGREQVPIITQCQEAGYEIIVISPEGNYPGFKYADRSYFCDVKEKEAILEIAKAENIDAIFTDQLEIGVLTAAFVAENLNIPGIGLDVALRFVNKLIMRESAKSIGVNVPHYYGITNIKEACDAAHTIGYPIIIKPCDSTASKGVYQINNEAELCEHFEETLSYSYDKTVLVEQLIIGKEFAVQSFSRDYEVTNLIIGHRDFFDFPNIFIPRAAVYIDANSAISESEKNILRTHEKVVSGYGLKFGIAYGEYIYDEDANEVYLVEVAARGAATYTSSDLIPLACGVNANRLLIEQVLENNTSYEPIILTAGAAAYFCFTLPEGKVINIENADKLEDLPGLHKAILDNISVGMEVPKIRDKSSRKGPILVYGNSKQDCYDAIEKVKETLKIGVKTPGGETDGIQWR